MAPRPTLPEELLPLHPVQLSILLVLRSGAVHGYGIMKRVNDGFGRRELVGPGTLYRTLKEMRDADLIEPGEPPVHEEDVDGRRQYYRPSRPRPVGCSRCSTRPGSTTWPRTREPASGAG